MNLVVVKQQQDVPSFVYMILLVVLYTLMVQELLLVLDLIKKQSEELENFIKLI